MDKLLPGLLFLTRYYFTNIDPLSVQVDGFEIPDDLLTTYPLPSATSKNTFTYTGISNVRGIQSKVNTAELPSCWIWDGESKEVPGVVAGNIKEEWQVAFRLMNQFVYEEDTIVDLYRKKNLLLEAVKANKKVFGIATGLQLTVQVMPVVMATYSDQEDDIDDDDFEFQAIGLDMILVYENEFVQSTSKRGEQAPSAPATPKREDTGMYQIPLKG